MGERELGTSSARPTGLGGAARSARLGWVAFVLVCFFPAACSKNSQTASEPPPDEVHEPITKPHYVPENVRGSPERLPTVPPGADPKMAPLDKPDAKDSDAGAPAVDKDAGPSGGRGSD